ncbi:hypothetical protein LCGC14_2586130 [marine sediment metagenome]|uniref:Uncharacterized protein n=1 Tax=marine sediment metagenome TaxID=412755 RepID=A0A0F9ADE4_9ZZZZ
MRCICQKWIETIRPRQQIHVSGEAISHCPFCGLELIKDEFRVFMTYDGPEDKTKEEAIEILLVAYGVKRMPGKKKLYFDLQLP